MAQTDEERRRIWAGIMRRDDVPGHINKHDLADTINAIDDWLDVPATRAAMRAIIPEPARSSLTDEDIERIACITFARRVGMFTVEEDG